MVTFRILTNPGLFNNYEHTIDFADIETQTAFWDGRTEATFGDGFKCNFLNNNKIILEGNYNSFRHSSYCCADVVLNGTTKRYYYFITNIQVAATLEPESLEQVMELTIEEDVMQTYMFDYSIKESFVEREHQDRAKKLDDGAIIPLFNTQKEDIGIGENYVIDTKVIRQDWEPQGTTENTLIIAWVLGAFKKPISDEPVISKDGLFYYAFPFTLRPYGFDFVFSCGRGHYVKYNEFFNYLRNAKGAADNVVSIYVVKNLGLPITEMLSSGNIRYIHGIDGISAPLETQSYWESNTWIVNPSIDDLKSDYVKLNIEDFSQIPKFESWNDYTQPASITQETKLLTFPYAFNKITNDRVDGLMVKNEYIKQGEQVDIRVQQSLDPMQKSAMWVENYEVGSPRFNQCIDNTTSELPVNSTAWAEYLSRHKASATTGMSVNVASDVGMGLITGGVGAALSLASGNVGGAITTGVGSAITTATRITNRLLAREDIKNSPNSVKGLGNNIGFDLIQNNVEYKVYRFSIVDDYKKRVYDYFLHYGYAANLFTIPNTKTRYYYNYIQCLINIDAKLNCNIINAIKMIYSNGITFWHYRDADTFLFNDYSKENQEMSLMENANG